MPEFVQQGEAGERAGQPQPELVAVQHDDEHHHHEESRAYMDGESEQPEHCCPGYDPFASPAPRPLMEQTAATGATA